MIERALDILRNLDTYLASFTSEHGVWVYALLFAIIFAETGLVVLPFLPGDSLLFTVGALAAREDTGINVWTASAPLPAEEPRAARQPVARLAHAPDERRLVRHVQQVDAEDERARPLEVRVVVDESRRDEAAAGVDDPRVRAAVPRDDLLAARGHDAVAANRDGFRRRPRRVARPDAGVREEQVGRLRERRAREGARERERDGAEP